jgi:hypothetical protein
MPQRNGTGMFPREVIRRFPLLPLEEDGRLNDMPLRENFIEREFFFLLSLDQDAGGIQDWQSFEDCQSFGALPYRPQAHPHGPQPNLTAGQATTPRWAASWRMRASGPGTS